MKKILLSPWLAIVTLSILISIRIYDPSFVESVRLRYFDQLLIDQPKKTVPVNIVDIDEATLEKFGQYPFSRDIYANIIKDLYDRNAGLVVFNILMAEQDRFKKDEVLSKTMEKYPVVLPIIGSTRNKNSVFSGNVIVVGQDPAGRTVEFPGIISNIDQLGEKSIGSGIVNTFPEIDGVVRRSPLMIASGGKLYPSLSLEVLRTSVNDDNIQVKIGDTGIEALRVPKFSKIETDSLSRIWIDWSQIPKEYSLMNLPKDFNQEIVIVGVSAAGLANPIATSVGEVWPHYLQGSIIGTMINGTTIKRINAADTLELSLIVVASILLLFLTRWLYVGIVAMLVIAIGNIYLSIYLFETKNLLFDSTAFTASIILVALHAYTVKFLQEFFQKQQIRKQFSTYMSPDLVAKLIKDPSLLHLGGEEKELTIQFTDLRGFTAISEHYGKDVEGLTRIMNRYMTAMTTVILNNRGTLDKFIGDATMAFWNAPLDETQHCKESVKAALEMLDELVTFNKQIVEEGIPPFGMGIGINTGIVVVGNMGSEQRFDYTCLGDAVNLASRLEGQSKNYGVLIILGPITAQRVGDAFFTLELDCIAVKGKKEGVNIYTVFYNPKEEEKDAWISAKNIHDRMLKDYRDQKWDSADRLLTKLKGSFNGQMDKYYEIWTERIKEMRNADLPKNWDGIYHANSK